MAEEIKAPAHLSPAAALVWRDLVVSIIPGPGFDAYCNQVSIERDAAARIAAEGLIVADAKR